MASILYSTYLNHLEKLQRFERRVTTPPFLMMIGLAAFIHLLVLLLWSFVPQRDYFAMPVVNVNMNVGSGEQFKDVLDKDLSAREKALREQLEARKQAIFERQEALKKKREEQRKKLLRQTIRAEIGVSAEESKARQKDEISTRKSSPVPDVGQFPWRKTPQRRVGSKFSGSAVPSAAGSNAGASAAPTTLAEQEKIMARYEQKLSAWIDRHKIYPFEAQEKSISGKVLLRLRIDRAGNVRRIRIQRSSGHQILDSAVIHAAKRSNPVPAVPASYPGGQLLEFIIPMEFSYKP